MKKKRNYDFMYESEAQQRCVGCGAYIKGEVEEGALPTCSECLGIIQAKMIRSQLEVLGHM